MISDWFLRLDNDLLYLMFELNLTLHMSDLDSENINDTRLTSDFIGKKINKSVPYVVQERNTGISPVSYHCMKQKTNCVVSCYQWYYDNYY